MALPASQGNRPRLFFPRLLRRLRGGTKPGGKPGTVSRGT
jgi:hypothetical protein